MVSASVCAWPPVCGPSTGPTDVNGDAFLVPLTDETRCVNGEPGWVLNNDGLGLTLCPATCGLLAEDPSAKLQVLYGCAEQAGTGGTGAGGSSATGGAAGTRGDSAYQCNKETGDTYCLCTPTISGEPGNSPVCSAASENGLCCKDTGYPDGLGSCSCMHWVCEANDDECSCSASVAAGTSRCLQSWGLCCAFRIGHFNNCVCDNFTTECDTDWTQVASCDVQAMECDIGEERKDSCGLL